VQAAPKAETVIDGSGGDDESSTPDKVYDLSRQIDGDPNPEDPNAGSTVTGGAKACVQLGFISSYHWATTAAQVAQSIQQIGPVVLGTDWTNDMFNPDPSGVIHPTGAVVGGHCYLAHGFDPTTGLIQLRNSWGSGWGIGGDAFISLADLDTLLTAQGEACVPIKP
jgi:hypothetical protein